MNFDQLKKQLEIHEGKKNHLYIDTLGHPTVGIGRNLDTTVFAENEIDLMFYNDLTPKWDQLTKALPWILELDEVRQHVLIDMAFNLGVQGLLNFKQTLGAIKAKDYQLAGSLMLQSRWASQVKERAIRLSRMMRTGQYPADLAPEIQ